MTINIVKVFIRHKGNANYSYNVIPLYPTRMTKIKSRKLPSVSEGAEQVELSYMVIGAITLGAVGSIL